MKKHWKFSKHFAERFVERCGGSKQSVKPIVEYFNNNVLMCVFDCVLYGTKQRTTIGNNIVCYVYDEHTKQIIVTTVYQCTVGWLGRRPIANRT